MTPRPHEVMPFVLCTDTEMLMFQNEVIAFQNLSSSLCVSIYLLLKSYSIKIFAFDSNFCYIKPFLAKVKNKLFVNLVNILVIDLNGLLY